jgi:hypothetical protein
MPGDGAALAEPQPLSPLREQWRQTRLLPEFIGLKWPRPLLISRPALRDAAEVILLIEIFNTPSSFRIIELPTTTPELRGC